MTTPVHMDDHGRLIGAFDSNAAVRSFLLETSREAFQLERLKEFGSDAGLYVVCDESGGRFLRFENGSVGVATTIVGSVTYAANEEQLAQAHDFALLHDMRVLPLEDFIALREAILAPLKTASDLVEYRYPGSSLTKH